MGKHIGVAAAYNILQSVAFPGDNQILQVNGTGKHAALVHHIQCGDVVVLAGLPYQLAHSAADGQCIRNADEVIAHAAADLRLMEGPQSPHDVPGVVVQLCGDGLRLFGGKLPQNIQRVRGVHSGNYVCRQCFRQLY